MKAMRFDFSKQVYEPYQVPVGATTLAEMDETVACAECGRPVEFGRCYTSRRIHAPLGMGYAVCPECHDLEWAEEQRAMGRQVVWDKGLERYVWRT